MFVPATKKSLTVKAYRGDAKTLLAFNFNDKKAIKNFAGFTIFCQPKGKTGYYLQNFLRYKDPQKHAQDPKEPATSTINAPIHKFRWLHIPGSVHQGLSPFMGDYTYIVTPRYFDDKQSMLPMDQNLSASVTITVDNFSKGNVELGFTRGYTQSQAFDNHFGKDALIEPKNADLQWDTSQVSGKDAQGNSYTFADEYKWLGFTAREKIFEILDEVVKNKKLYIDVFAYDLNEPDVVSRLLTLAKQKRIRVILDNAALHHTNPNAKPKPPKPGQKAMKPQGPTMEDKFEKLFIKAGGKTAIKRGKFGRYAHDKVFVVYSDQNRKKPVKVLTGSTNFSVTGMYVNSNHVLVYNDTTVAGFYAGIFGEAWKDDVKMAPFQKSKWSNQTFSSNSAKTPPTKITFAPHTDKTVGLALDPIVKRIAAESKKGKTTGSVLFAVMEMAMGSSEVYDALKTLHSDQTIFSYGISDDPSGIFLYTIGKKSGVLVTGKPNATKLPPPFNQVRNIGGVGHQVHHKFVVCGFNGSNPTVYCGSSNLAGGGETNNGDNLLEIRDADVATVFAIEALALVDHFDFLDRSSPGKSKKATTPSKTQAAAQAEWFLSTTDSWAQKYFDPKDLKSVDRELFG